MIQRIQTIYMLLLVTINLFVIVSIDSNPEISLPESIFGYFRTCINEYFFSEILAVTFLINIFLFSKPKFQINVLKITCIALLIGLFGLFDDLFFNIVFFNIYVCQFN